MQEKATHNTECTWPSRLMLVSYLISIFEASVLLPTLCGDNEIRLVFVVGIWGLVGVRWLLAVLLRETGKGYLFYCIVLVGSPWLWRLIEFVYVDLLHHR